MVKYTTPTFSLTVSTSVDLTDATNIYATFIAPGVNITKTGDDLDVSEHQVDVFFTQAETGSIPQGALRIQLNWTYLQGGVAKRACSEIASVNVTPNLLSEVVS